MYSKLNKLNMVKLHQYFLANSWIQNHFFLNILFMSDENAANGDDVTDTIGIGSRRSFR